VGCWLGLTALKTLYFCLCKVIKNLKIKLKGFCKENTVCNYFDKDILQEE
jgi:hypothetical protein